MKEREILYSPIATEKTMLLTERENKIAFIVDRNATRAQIKKAFEDLYQVKVESVRVLRTRRGKKAILKLTEDYSADDLAGRIGLF